MLTFTASRLSEQRWWVREMEKVRLWECVFGPDLFSIETVMCPQSTRHKLIQTMLFNKSHLKKKMFCTKNDVISLCSCYIPEPHYRRYRSWSTTGSGFWNKSKSNITCIEHLGFLVCVLNFHGNKWVKVVINNLFWSIM